MFVALNPQHNHFPQTIRDQIPRVLAHELHHCMRTRGPGYGETLAEALISEGLADHFDHEVWGKEPQLWSIALTDEQALPLLERARGELDNKPYNHAAWFFGSAEQHIPRWTGYTLGFRLVADYLRLHPEQTAAELHAMPASAFIESAGDA